MTVNTINSVNTSLSGQTGTGPFAGGINPDFTNPTANNFVNGYDTTVTAAATTTLTVTSNAVQFFTGSTTQVVKLPDVTTLVALGQSYTIVNNSSGNVTVESSGSNSVIVLSSGQQSVITCILLTGTTAASWYATLPSSGTGTVDAGTAGQIAVYASSGDTVSGSSTMPTSFPWVNNVDQTSSSVTMTYNTQYLTDNGATLVTYTLPATIPAGATFIILGYSSGGWQVNTAAGQNIVMGIQNATNYVASSPPSDCIILSCVVANT